ncbi:MAG: hypothetical protein PHQ36_04240 [Anaerolineales bacterium]|nr:hypothetical protein [Anaerolineales bacterium]
MANLPSLRIDTGEIRLAVNDDPERVIAFNPKDVVFVERFYALFGEFEKKMNEYETRAHILDRQQDVDEHGMHKNAAARLALMRESCEYARKKIDNLFGDGTSQKAFGNAMTFDVFHQFFDGITPFIKKTRIAHINKYTRDLPSQDATKKPKKRKR